MSDSTATADGRAPQLPARAGPSQPGQATGLAPWQVARLQRHIEAFFAARLTNAELAGLVGLGGGHFLRAFKASFGLPPHAYVTQARIRAAQRLLQTDMRLAEIALSCGFFDQAHFCRKFRDQIGESPSAWRRALQVRRRAAA